MRFKWTVEIEVDETWVADGFDFNNPGCLQGQLDGFLPWATEAEKSIKVIKSPDRKKVAKVQGYKSVEAMEADYDR